MEYCERTTAGLWAEPLNAVTNLAFIVAGVLLLRILLRRGARPVPWETVVLVFLVFSIGVGSGLWHTLATPWSELADVVPITLYINLFFVGVEWFTDFYNESEHAASIRYLYFGLHGYDSLVPWVWTAFVFNVIAVTLLSFEKLRSNMRYLVIACLLAFTGTPIVK